jgi:DNA-binding CsgD family transcriptional regulator
MPLRPHDWTQPIRVALRIADPALLARIVRACEERDVILAGGDEAADDAEIVLADRPLQAAGRVIALGFGQPREAWPCDVRARVPGDIDATTLGAVIAVVAAGLTVMPREGIARSGAWAETQDCDEPELSEPPAALTPREHDVLALLVEGATNKAIARALGVSVHTAKFHVASLTEKLGASGRLEAVAIALRSGLVMV